MNSLVMSARFILAFMLVVSHTGGYSQPSADEASPANGQSGGSIKGRVIDDRTSDPLPYTNIILSNLADSSFVKGTVADEQGHFILENVPMGTFYLEAKFMGYIKTVIHDITVNQDNLHIQLDNLYIVEATTELEEVVVSADRSLVEYKIDKKIVNISENINAMGSSVAHALSNVPSITVDIDGNVSLRGSSNFTVLIDGKPSPLEGSDALRQIPATAVEQIEIITNPSARYDPDGLSGIINVITKKRALDGLSGIVNASVGTRDKYRGDFLVNYKNDRFSVFLGADVSDETRNGERNIVQSSLLDDTVKYIEHTGDSPFRRQGYTLKGGIGYNLNDMNAFSLEGSYGYGSFSRGSTENFKEYTFPSSFENYYKLDESDKRYEDFYSISLNHELQFKEKDHKLTSYIYYSSEWGGSNEFINQYVTDQDWNIIDHDPYRIHTEEPGEESEFRFQTDYTKPLGDDGKLEAGYQVRNDREKESYHFKEWDENTGDWLINDRYSNACNFYRTIQAIYGIYAHRLLGFDYQLGIRGEYTFRSVQNIQSDQPSELERLDYFPTVHISRKMGEKNQAQVNYSRRIRRPRGFELDPFINYMDPNTLRMGNPELSPEYTDSYEMSYQREFNKGALNFEGYYRLTHDAMTRVTKFTDDGLRLLTVENLNEEHAMGTEVMFNFMVNKWFNFNISGNIYRFRLNGNVSETEVARASTNFDSRLNANFKLATNTRFQLQAFYQGPSTTAQGRREDFLMTSAAIKQDFLKDKFSATLQINDIFGTASFNFINEGATFSDSINMRRESQVVMLSLSYRINNYKKQNGERNGNNENSGGMEQQDY